ncbi:hypothetical protein EV421DRAFT_2033136 [Armillaria borealis]|uniref:DUF6697 domain-containing protein n=1 Tax=Armillaria borealis TaxID=47425 RepID=A0AA39MVY9_9AGAR|nr:hypothetical protein EV421DRAFT_2033136 [Armillaria borealis]
MVAKKEDVDDVSILALGSPHYSSKDVKFEDHVPSGFSTPGSLAESHIVPKTEDILSRSSSPLTSIDSRSSSEIPTPKKRRIMTVEVVVPTLRAVLDKVPAGIERVEEEDDEIMEKLVNKAQNIELSLDTVRNRLKGIEFHEVPLDRDVRDVVVDRLFMSKVYGGNSQETFPRVAQKFLDVHHMDDFMYLNLNMNPHAPQVPGAPGLFFEADDMVEPVDELGSKIKRVFSRIDSAQWEYMGQYKMEPVASLTMDEWNEQRNTVRLVWASKLSTSGWGIHCRAVVHLHEQLGRKPTKREVEEALRGENKYWNVTREHIAEAFLKGWVTMAVWTMKCVDYDVNFQRELVAKYANWVPPPSKPKGTSKPRTGTKRKREEHRALDEEEDERRITEDLVYHPKGTRTRPGRG